MRILKTSIRAGVAGGVLLTAGAFAQPFNVACVKGDDSRQVEIVAPGEVGAACDVRYTLSSAVRTPYHANNSESFCRTKADEIVSNLISGGYACGPVGGTLTAEARPAPEPVVASAPDVAEPAPEEAPQPLQEPVLAPTAEIIETAPAAPETQVAVEEPVEASAAVEEDVAAASIVETASPEPISEPAPEPAAVVAAAPSGSASEPASEPSAPKIEQQPQTQPEPSPAPAAAAEDVATAEDTIALAETPVGATRGPATLAGEGLEKLEPSATRPSAGRLVGAEPDPEPEVEAKVAVAAAAPNSGVAEPVQVSLAPTPPPSSSKKADRLRDPEDIIVATLNAQAAAWNEGNLQAFMDIYWNDDDLKFVSGTSITRGWTATMKRYRDRYSGETGLGVLSFEKTDVELVTDDVAVVTGRFNHVKGEDASSGVFSLVMKQADGVWRIVHDHTAVDAPKNQ